MKIDITSMFFNSSIVGKTATAAWGTSVGKQTPPCTIYESADIFNVISGMIYCSKTDYENLSIDEMSKTRELILFSVFDKVYVNGNLIDGSFILLLVREHSASHDGRMLVSYPKYAKYKREDGEDVENESTMNNVAQSLGITKDDTWFVYDISVANQDTLLINACAAGTDKYKQFIGTSKLRSQEWGDIVENSNNPDNEKTRVILSIPNQTRPFLTAIRTKPFLLLAGISGTGKSRIVRKLAQATNDIDVFAKDEDRWKLHKPANFELIQVKPNWHNSMDVVGFKSNIGGEHYEFTPFVDFVLKAWQHENTPFFLCLDEMNLAPVEEYFAEFLSAIENRAVNDEGEYETDPVIKPFDSFGPSCCGEMMRHIREDLKIDLPLVFENKLRQNGLTLPKNLIVMGTVNMDETTFSFSRKVLDRAMSIEMNKVNYTDFLAGKTEEDINCLTTINGLLVDRPTSAQQVKNDIDGEAVISYLSKVNELLDGTPFKLGYRAANEAMLYVAANKILGINDVKTALDDFTLMKILSRIEGDDEKLVTKQGNKLLDALTDLLRQEDMLGTVAESRSLAKLNNMSRSLGRDHFVSFWG